MRFPFKYREEYLLELVTQLRPRFQAVGVEVPAVRCSCSFAYRGGRRVIGQCFPGAMAGDGVPQIKISPVLEDPVAVAAVLVHELIHACRPGAGHGKAFREVAIPIGLVGPMRSTSAGQELHKELTEITGRLGPYPHAAINLDAGRRVPAQPPPGGPRVADEPTKQKGRLIKVACPIHRYPARVTRVWLAQMGPPICPCGVAMVVAPNQPLMSPRAVSATAPIVSDAERR